MTAKRPPIQLELDLPMPGRGEAPRLDATEVEVVTAMGGDESPARADRLMEVICDWKNVETAAQAVMRNKGAPGIDGMTVKQLPEVLKARWPQIACELVEGSYRPQPVKRVRIPKPDDPTGGPATAAAGVGRHVQRVQLRIPTGAAAHQAVAAAQAYVVSGYEHVVDIDLAKFFDRVNHDRLMARVAKRVTDKRVLRLIRAFLTAGAFDDGAFAETREGTPQGGPLSPLLSNLVLDELDRELERRGLCFVRYADDCNIYVRSEKAARRVMASVTRFLERRLKLQVNEAKSAVDRPWNRTFLGFTLGNAPGFPRAIAPKALRRFKERIREATGRHRGVSLKRMIADLNPLLRGWAGYFGFSEGREMASLDGWIRRRLRCMLWTQWKTRRRRFSQLRRGGVSEKTTYAAIMSCKGPWRLSSSEALHRALRNKTFAKAGLVSMATYAPA